VRVAKNSDFNSPIKYHKKIQDKIVDIDKETEMAIGNRI
jgi:hypothetical protein